MSIRLSCACFPLPTPISTFTCGPFQYIRSATSECPPTVLASNSLLISRVVKQQPPLPFRLVLLDAGPLVRLDIRAVKPDLRVLHPRERPVQASPSPARILLTSVPFSEMPASYRSRIR